MSNKDDSTQDPEVSQKKSEFLLALDDTINFVKSCSRRKLNDDSIRIIIDRNLIQVEDLGHELMFQSNLSPANQKPIIKVALEKILTITNGMPTSEVFANLRKEFSSFSNFLRVILVAINFSSNIGLVESSAILLAEVLTGIQHYDEAPKLPDTSHFDFRRTYIANLNAMNSTANVYSSLISALFIIEERSLLEWVGIVNKHFKLALGIVEQVDDMVFYPHYHKSQRVEFFFQNCLVSFAPYLSVFELLKELFGIYGENWPKGLSMDHFLIPPPTYDALLSYVESMEDKIKGGIERLNQAYKEGLIDQNENPKNSESIQEGILLIESLTLFRSRQRTLEVSFSDVDVQEKVELLKKTIKESSRFTQKLADFKGGFEQLMNTHLGEDYVLEFEELIPLIARLSVLSGSQQIFETLLSGYRHLINEESFEPYPKLMLTYVLSKLYVQTRLEQPLDYTTLLGELTKLKFYLKGSLWESVTISILMTLLRYIKSEDSPNNLIVELGNIREEVFISGHQKHVDTLLNNYIKEFMMLLSDNDREGSNGDKDNGEEELSQVKIEPNLLDKFTWLIPDFKPYTSQKKLRPFYYIPFNTKAHKLKR